MELGLSPAGKAPLACMMMMMIMFTATWHITTYFVHISKTSTENPHDLRLLRTVWSRLTEH